MLIDHKKILVVGASSNRAEASNHAVRTYLEHGFKVFPVNPHEPEIEGLPSYRSLSQIREPVYSAAFYVPPSEGLRYVDGLHALGVRRLFLHPRAASGRLILIAQGQQIEVEAVDAVKALERTLARV